MLIDDRPSREALALSFREQIGAKIAESKELDERIRDLVLLKVNSARAVGVVIDAARRDLSPTTFREIADAVDLSDDAIRQYVSFAKKHPVPIKDFSIGIRAAFESALRASNALPAPEQRTFISHDPPGFFNWTSQTLMQFGVRWKKYLAVRPLDSWNVSQAEQFLYGLRPVLKCHKAVADWLRRQPPQ